MNTVLAERIKERMAALGLNACRTATKAALGRSYVRDILRGRISEPGSHRLQKLAAVLECSPEYLLGPAVTEAQPASPPRTIPPAPAMSFNPILLEAKARALAAFESLSHAEITDEPRRGNYIRVAILEAVELNGCLLRLRNELAA